MFRWSFFSFSSIGSRLVVNHLLVVWDFHQDPILSTDKRVELGSSNSHLSVSVLLWSYWHFANSLYFAYGRYALAYFLGNVRSSLRLRLLFSVGGVRFVRYYLIRVSGFFYVRIKFNAYVWVKFSGLFPLLVFHNKLSKNAWLISFDSYIWLWTGELERFWYRLPLGTLFLGSILFCFGSKSL